MLKGARAQLLLLFAILRLKPKRTASHRGRLLLIAVVVVLAGCARRASVAPTDYLQVDINVPPTTLDPRFATDAMSGRIDELVYESMVRFDQAGKPVDELAERIDQPEPTRLVFHLRHGVRFSDGHELTARDVKFTYDTVLDPSSGSMRRSALAELKSINVLDDYTVEMTARRPYAPALEMATLPIVPAGSPSPHSSLLIAPAGSGPFRFAMYRRDEALLLERNPTRPYQPGTARRILFKIVPDATVRALELVEGICDFTENDGIQRDLIPYLERHPFLHVERSPGSFLQYLAFNLRDPRLKDIRLRRAFAAAIDRKAIIRSMLQDTATPATGFLIPENWAYAGDVERYEYDPDKARQLIEAAGYSKDDPRLRFVYKTTPEGHRMAEILQAMLKQAGITLEIHTNEWATFYADLQRGNFALAASQLAVASPHDYYFFLHSSMMPPHGSNRVGYSNPEMDHLLEQADTTMDPIRRRAICAQIQQLAARDIPYLPLWWIDTLTIANQRARGFVPYPDGSLRSLATVRFSPPAAPIAR